MEQIDEAREISREVVDRIRRRVRSAGYGNTPDTAIPEQTLLQITEEETAAHNAFCDRTIAVHGRAPTLAEVRAETTRREGELRKQ